MATTSEARALPFFTDLLGQPLSSGFIYIGQAGLDPVAYPAVVTSDIAGTIVVAQPIRTTNGHAAAAGALIHLFVPIPYSITILDSARRVVYASLNETDPVAVAVGSSSVQSASSLADLRSRSGSSTNQIWVSGFGMYVYNPADTTSPESIPTVIVGNDGSRYDLSMQFVNAGWVNVTGIASPLTKGAWLSWNDNADGGTVISNNPGTVGAGGFTFRVMAADGVTQVGTASMSSTGAWTVTGDVRSGGNVIAQTGVLAMNAGGSRSLLWNSATDQYELAATSLKVNGWLAVTEANILAEVQAQLTNIFVNRLVGCTLIGTTTPTPGTWALMISGVSSSGVAQYVRTA